MPQNDPALASCLDRYLKALLDGDRQGVFRAVSRGLEARLGPRQLYLDVLMEGQRRVGDLWAAGEVTVAQEHLASEIVLSVMDQLRRSFARYPANGLRAVASAVEGERHSVAVQAVADLFYLEGWSVDCLGGDTPTEDLARFVEKRSAVLVLLSAAIERRLPAAAAAVERLRELPAPPRILLGGAAFERAPPKGEAAHADLATTDCRLAIDRCRELFKGRRRAITLPAYLTRFGRRVRGLRKLKNLRQGQLAGRAGIDRAFLSQVEHGKQNLSLGAVIKIAGGLGVPVEALLCPGEAAAGARSLKRKADFKE